MTVQPTEQFVHTDLTVLTASLTADCADAFVTEPAVAPIAAKPPMAKPDPRRNERRSTDFSATLDRRLARWERLATPLVFFLSIIFSPLLIWQNCQTHSLFVFTVVWAFRNLALLGMIMSA
jgi:hypothetical protein